MTDKFFEEKVSTKLPSKQIAEPLIARFVKLGFSESDFAFDFDQEPDDETLLAINIKQKNREQKSK